MVLNTINPIQSLNIDSHFQLDVLNATLCGKFCLVTCGRLLIYVIGYNNSYFSVVFVFVGCVFRVCLIVASMHGSQNNTHTVKPALVTTSIKQ